LEDKTGLAFECFDETPLGDCIIRKYRNDIEQVKLIRDDIVHLIEEDKVLPRQIVILIHSDKKSSCLVDVKKIKKYPLKSAYRPKDIRDNDIIYATIEIFKGLESDVVLLADTHLFKDDEIQKRLYVEASRAKHRLYVYERESL
jgi:DNA helicase IV